MRVFPRGVATGGQMEPSLHLSLPTYWPPVKSSTLGWMKRPTRSLVPATRRGGRTNLWDDCETPAWRQFFAHLGVSPLVTCPSLSDGAGSCKRHTHTLACTVEDNERGSICTSISSLKLFLTTSILPPLQPFSGNVDLRITASSIGWQLSLESAFNGPLQVINWLFNQLNNQPDRLEFGALNSFSEREFLEFVTPKP